ncbi:MAG TPA: hypothetical protein VG672_28365 [Bryobacteraceae bacterium]|nr:hypothetical protein [Bryobacteraceae bacterium]
MTVIFLYVAVQDQGSIFELENILLHEHDQPAKYLIEQELDSAGDVCDRRLRDYFPNRGNGRHFSFNGENSFGEQNFNRLSWVGK